MDTAGTADPNRSKVYPNAVVVSNKMWGKKEERRSYSICLSKQPPHGMKYLLHQHDERFPGSGKHLPPDGMK